MKARRALLNDAVMGVAYVAAGAVSSGVALAAADRELDAFALIVGAVLACGAIAVLAWGARAIGRAPALPAAVTFLSSSATVGRALGGVVAPLAVIVYVSTLPTPRWTLGLGSIALGFAMLAVAGVAARAERRFGARVYRIGNDYFAGR